MDKKDLYLSSLKQKIKKPFHLEGDIWLVPCMATSSENSFRPLLKPLDLTLNTNEYTRKQLWNSIEDQALLNLVSVKGPKYWSVIARELNSLIHNGLHIRQGRQCRERWFNHVDPLLNKGQWTPEEDELLIEKQRELGNKWSEISKVIKGRNENAVKNRWKSLANKKECCISSSAQSYSGDFDDNCSIFGASDIEYYFSDENEAKDKETILEPVEKKNSIKKMTIDIPKTDLSKQEEKQDISPSSLFLSIF